MSVSDQFDRVIARLRKEIDSAFYQANEQRILFAVAVDTIECWLLPLLYEDNKAAKITGCLESANRAVQKADEPRSRRATKKFTRRHVKASRGYRKRKTLTKLRDKNPSLELFIERLAAVQSRLSTTDPAAGQGGRLPPDLSKIHPGAR